MNGRRRYGPQEASKYANRSQGRHRAEVKLLSRTLAGLDVKGPVLDVPCGIGRLGEPFKELGVSVTRADLSPSMLQFGQKGICADASHLPFRDRSFPLVISWRFLHHVTPTELPLILKELARVADRWLLVSFFHPFSAHGWQRGLECSFLRKKSNRFSVKPTVLRAILRQQGFQPVRFTAQNPWFRELWAALFFRQ